MVYEWSMHGLMVATHRHPQPALRRGLLPAVLAGLGHESAWPPVPVLVSLAVLVSSLAVLCFAVLLAFAVRVPPTLALGMRRGRVSRGRWRRW